jgi:hypothetical protein
VSLDAMDWVWTKSTARGNARTVLLAIADRCPDARCVAYAGTAMLLQRTNAARSSVIAAVDRLLASGELVIVEGVKGPRGETVYHLPHAVGHTRAESDTAAVGGTDSGPVQNPDPSENETPGGRESGPPGYENRTPQGVRKPDPGGPESGLEGYENETPRGPVFGPQNARERKHQKEQQPRAHARDRSPVVEQLRPLAAALQAAGVEVRWSLGLGEQRDVWHLAERHGVAALVELAARRTTPGDAPKSARYWLKVWADLDRAPAPPASIGGNVVPLRGRAPASHTDALRAGLALLESQERGGA